YGGPPVLPSYWIRVRRVAPNALAGWNALMPAYDAFRGLIELVYNLGSISLFTWPPSARHACIPPPWCLVAPATGDFEFYPFGNRETLNEEPLVLVKSAWKQIRLVADLIKAEPGSPHDFRWLIGDLFRLYSQAMDADRPYATFLGFWQLAEAITLVGERQGNHNGAIGRIATFLRGVDSDAALSVLRVL